MNHVPNTKLLKQNITMAKKRSNRHHEIKHDEIEFLPNSNTIGI